MKEEYVYRIPKHVEAKMTLWGMDWKGWLAFAVGLLITVVQFMLFPPTKGHIGFALKRTAIVGLIFVGGPLIFSRNSSALDAFFQIRYHRKNAKLIKWESDPNAVIESQEEN